MDKKTQPKIDSMQKLARPRLSRKSKFILMVILALASVYGIYAYINKSPDPTTWESLRNDYKNTK